MAEFQVISIEFRKVGIDFLRFITGFRSIVCSLNRIFLRSYRFQETIVDFQSRFCLKNSFEKRAAPSATGPGSKTLAQLRFTLRSFQADEFGQFFSRHMETQADFVLIVHFAAISVLCCEVSLSIIETL